MEKKFNIVYYKCSDYGLVVDETTQEYQHHKQQFINFINQSNKTDEPDINQDNHVDNDHDNDHFYFPGPNWLGYTKKATKDMDEEYDINGGKRKTRKRRKR